MGCNPIQYSQVQAPPISPVETHRRQLRISLCVGASSRPEILHLSHGARVVARRHLVRRHGVARWSFGLCGRLWERKGRVEELEKLVGFR